MGVGVAGVGFGDAVAWALRRQLLDSMASSLGWFGSSRSPKGGLLFSDRFAVAVEANWEGFPEVIRFLTEANRLEALSEWGLYLVFDDDGVLVGNAGWKGEPINGAAELGYAVAPSRQGRGIATAVVRELVTRAVSAGLREVIAHTRAAESPSTSVLCQHIEEFDGRVSRFAHHRLLDRVRDLMDRLYQLDPEWTEKD